MAADDMGTIRTGSAPRRPALVWVIALFAWLSAIWTLLGLWVMNSGLIPMTPATEQYMASMKSLNGVLFFVTLVVNVAASILMFLLRRRAVSLYILALVLNVASLVYNLLATNWLEASPPGTMVGYVIGLCIQAAIILYARRLAARQVLR